MLGSAAEAGVFSRCLCRGKEVQLTTNVSPEAMVMHIQLLDAQPASYGEAGGQN